MYVYTCVWIRQLIQYETWQNDGQWHTSNDVVYHQTDGKNY